MRVDKLSFDNTNALRLNKHTYLFILHWAYYIQ